MSENSILTLNLFEISEHIGKLRETDTRNM